MAASSDLLLKYMLHQKADDLEERLNELEVQQNQLLKFAEEMQSRPLTDVEFELYRAGFESYAKAAIELHEDTEKFKAACSLVNINL